MRDPTTPAERKALRIAAEKVGGREWLLAERVTRSGLSIVEDGLSHGMFPITAERHEASYVATANPSLILRLLSDLAAAEIERDMAKEHARLCVVTKDAERKMRQAAEAQIAEAKREGMLEAAGIALAFRDGNPNALERMQHWGPRIEAAIRAASGGRDGERCPRGGGDRGEAADP